MWIPTETAFVNPGNIAPAAANCSTEHGAECSGEKYFTDEAVLDKWVANDEKTVKWIFNQLKSPPYCAVQHSLLFPAAGRDTDCPLHNRPQPGVGVSQHSRGHSLGLGRPPRRGAAKSGYEGGPQIETLL